MQRYIINKTNGLRVANKKTVGRVRSAIFFSIHTESTQFENLTELKLPIYCQLGLVPVPKPLAPSTYCIGFVPFNFELNASVQLETRRWQVQGIWPDFAALFSQNDRLSLLLADWKSKRAVKGNDTMSSIWNNIRLYALFSCYLTISNQTHYRNWQIQNASNMHCIINDSV